MPSPKPLAALLFGTLITATTTFAADDCPACNKGKAQKSEDPAAGVSTLEVALQTKDAGQLPDAKPGECFVRVRKPAVYDTVKETVVISPATIRYDIVPAKFKTVEKKILIRPETKRYEVIPAVFEKKTVTVTNDPAHHVLSAVEPQLTKKDQTVVTMPERSVWKQGRNALGKLEATVGDIWCLVREPAKTQTITTMQLTKAAEVKSKPIAAKTSQVETMVMTKPAQVKEIIEPAQYKTIRVRELVAAATKKKVDVPAKTKVVDRKVLKTPETVVWQRVLCETNVTEKVVKHIENRLKKAGFNPGDIDGHLGPSTLDAVRKYQLKHKLATGGLTYEFLDHIGVKP